MMLLYYCDAGCCLPYIYNATFEIGKTTCMCHPLTLHDTHETKTAVKEH